jgi:hypothetical protein
MELSEMNRTMHVLILAHVSKWICNEIFDNKSISYVLKVRYWRKVMEVAFNYTSFDRTEWDLWNGSCLNIGTYLNVNWKCIHSIKSISVKWLRCNSWKIDIMTFDNTTFDRTKWDRSNGMDFNVGIHLNMNKEDK